MSEFVESYIPFEGMPKDKRATLVVYGFDPIPGQLDPVVRHFADETDVFVYSYNNEVVSGGDPTRLPKLVGDLTLRAEEIVSEYGLEHVRTVGASLGSCIAMNVHDEVGLITPGVYATAGVNVANNFMRNPVFRLFGVPQKYKQNGFDASAVREAWSDIDIHSNRQMKPTTKFWCSASIFDPVVWYPLAWNNLRRIEGAKLQRSTAVLHTAAINEMANHIVEATEAADALAD